MSSNSIRISIDLFERAQRQGALMCRSTAQQVEHWARLGAALEADLAGADVHRLMEKLDSADVVYAELAPEAVLVKFKRDRQSRDLARVSSGQASNDQMSWFSKRKARSAKVVGEPF